MIKTITLPEYKIETIGICGRKDTNKRLCAELLKAAIEEVGCSSPIVNTRFTEPIYQTLISLFSPKVSWERMQDKNAEIPGLAVDGKPATGRLLMQSFGDYCKSIYPDVFVDRIFKTRIPNYLYIIYDVRFPDEAAAIMRHNGTIIRIKTSSDSSEDMHVTETAMDNVQFPIVIQCENRKDMKEDVREIAKSLWSKKLLR